MKKIEIVPIERHKIDEFEPQQSLFSFDSLTPKTCVDSVKTMTMATPEIKLLNHNEKKFNSKWNSNKSNGEISGSTSVGACNGGANDNEDINTTQNFESNIPKKKNKSGLEKLVNVNSIFIQQKADQIEELTDCEIQNDYEIFASDTLMQKIGQPLFECQERNTRLARSCLSAECRPLSMEIFQKDELNNNTEDPDYNFLFLNVKKSCGFICCCIKRPEIIITFKHNEQESCLGKIYLNYSPWNMKFTIYDHKQKFIFEIWGSGFQSGLFCSCATQKCSTIRFFIKNPEKEIVGEINKFFAGTLDDYIEATDYYHCQFPVNCPPEHKALLLVSTLFIDYRYFEASPQEADPMEIS